jgi:hypothetical protein
VVLSHGGTLVWIQILPAHLPSLQTTGDVDDVCNEECSHNAQDNHHNQDLIVILGVASDFVEALVIRVVEVVAGDMAHSNDAVLLSALSSANPV